MKVLTECNLAQIVSDILDGKTVVFPTETSYGLGCDATNQKAVDQIFKIKQRKADKPLLVVVPSIEMAKEYLVWNDELEKISKLYWPGTVTVVGEARPHPTLPLKGEGTIRSPYFQGGGRGWSRALGSRILGNVRTIPFRKELRTNKTNAEKELWQQLRLKRLGGLRFRRQHGIGPYIVDFYHSETKTVIEIDGDVHFVDNENVKKDKNRQQWLEKNGYRVLRYNNVDIFNNLNWILEEIYNTITARPHPTLPLKGEESETPPCPPLKRGGNLATGVVSPQGTVALRVTSHPLLKLITEKIGRPLVATSANISEAGNMYDAEKVEEQFFKTKYQPDIILDYGELPKRKPSTLVSVVGNELKVLRQGEIKVS